MSQRMSQRTLSIILDDDAKTVTLEGEILFDAIEQLGLAEYLRIAAHYKMHRIIARELSPESTAPTKEVREK